MLIDGNEGDVDVELVVDGVGERDFSEGRMIEDAFEGAGEG